jgi:hypothetical protein
MNYLLARPWCLISQHLFRNLSTVDRDLCRSGDADPDFAAANLHDQHGYVISDLNFFTIASRKHQHIEPPFRKRPIPLRDTFTPETQQHMLSFTRLI